MVAHSKLVFTIGHSTHSLDHFVELLKTHRITALADVRSTPYSRFNPQFNKDSFKDNLKSHGIKYAFLGRELGARSDDPTCYENGRVQYSRLARTEQFRQGLERVIKGSHEYQIAIMCAEKEPLECHRTLLVARALDEQGIDITHILGNGNLEDHRTTMKRLLDVSGLPQDDLFISHDKLIRQALAQQEERIAYVDEKIEMDAHGAQYENKHNRLYQKDS